MLDKLVSIRKRKGIRTVSTVRKSVCTVRTGRFGRVHNSYGIGNDIVTDEKTVWSRMFSLDELEMLNSDYINEHYGQLQDEAYQRGLEDGKWKAEDGCDGCKYYEDTSLTNPCSECSRGHVDHYKPLSDPDRIEVGDEVIAPCGKAIVTTFKNDLVFYLYSVGNYGCTEPENLTKTGRHFDIASILEAIRA